MKTQMVWYASYGSNMDVNRFACYIAGGTPKGGSRVYKGCDDTSMPVANTAVELPHQLYFTGESKVWTGGIALIRHDFTKQVTKGRAHLITAQQFEQVVAQESHHEHTTPINLSLVRSEGYLALPLQGGYDGIVYCGEHEGYPVLSCTSPIEHNMYTKPAPTYLKMISTGLKETHHLTTDEVCTYLLAKPGVAGNYSHAQLLSAIG